MCVALAPIALAGISTAVGIASSVASHAAQAKQARQQEEYNQQVYNQQLAQRDAEAEYQGRLVEQQNQYIEQNREAAMIALSRDRQALVSREREESLAVSLDLEQKRLERLKATGALKASGKAGVSYENLMSDFYRQEASYRSIGQQNLGFTRNQLGREGQSLTATAESRINDARPYQPAPLQQPDAPKPVNRPSGLATLTNIGASALGAYTSYSAVDSSGRFRLGTSSRLPSYGSSSTSIPRSNHWSASQPSQRVVPQSAFFSPYVKQPGK